MPLAQFLAKIGYGVPILRQNSPYPYVRHINIYNKGLKKIRQY